MVVLGSVSHTKASPVASQRDIAERPVEMGGNPCSNLDEDDWELSLGYNNRLLDKYRQVQRLVGGGGGSGVCVCVKV